MNFAPFGVVFDRMTPAETLAWVLDRDPAAPFDYLVTPNVDHLGRLRARPELMGCYRAASLRLLDSRVLWWLMRFCRLDPPPVVTGADLVASLLPALDTRGARVTLIGLEPGHAAMLITRFPGIVFKHHAPARKFEHDPVAFARARDFVRDHPADCVFLAVGSPRQEMLAHAVKVARQASGLGLCVGAAPLFVIGVLRRAPHRMREAGLEWLWRFAQEPRRLARRYLIDGPRVVVRVIAEGLRHRR
ncbi:WecB/TagA/CpsF family glycosyltransferase [Acidiphilium iwatense]|uniref:WecB/TagA/CpsF family glycosyltransferase n=1 Tax=Acidiphilium iwatense TaxID=768198 RepID=A0ABS9DZU5_9PROT|nr:WecB/TagA/CpsF family glycosyltransferase [Acidiphilium iwatense]MCF3948223.1 WecB/TagA/CpsF family glycosyltransferase [Acidiphilium iwatense]